jgi:hypothetical protein
MCLALSGGEMRHTIRPRPSKSNAAFAGLSHGPSVRMKCHHARSMENRRPAGAEAIMALGKGSQRSRGRESNIVANLSCAAPSRQLQEGPRPARARAPVIASQERLADLPEDEIEKERILYTGRLVTLGHNIGVVAGVGPCERRRWRSPAVRRARRDDPHACLEDA